MPRLDVLQPQQTKRRSAEVDGNHMLELPPAGLSPRMHRAHVLPDRPIALRLDALEHILVGVQVKGWKAEAGADASLRIAEVEA